MSNTSFIVGTILLIIGVIVGGISGCRDERQRLHREAIERGHAEYHQQTGAWHGVFKAQQEHQQQVPVLSWGIQLPVTKTTNE